MRVLHVIPSLSPKHGGPSFALPAIARALAGEGVEVTIATTDDDGPGGRLAVPIGQAVPGPDEATLYYFRKNTEFYKVSLGLRRWLRKNVPRFDVVHVHALFSFSSIAGARAAHRAGVPYIVRPLGVLNRWGLENRRAQLKKWSLRFLEVPLLKRAAAIHYTSAAEREEAAAADPAIGSVRSAIIPLPVEMPDNQATPKDHVLAAEFPRANGRPVILFMSRLDEKKGIELLLHAFVAVRREHPDTLLVIAGSGAPRYAQSLVDLAQTLGCAADILWAGYVSGQAKAALLAGATVFVLPSFSENFGIAAAEALAAGLPSVLSKAVAVSSDARAADAALVVEAEAGEVARALGDLLGDKSLRERLSENGRRLVRERYSAKAVGQSLVALYRDLLPSSQDYD